MAANHIGVGQIIAVDIVQEKLQMAKELGATDAINSREQSNVVEAIKKALKSGADPLMFLLGNKKLIGVIEGDSNPEKFIPQRIELHQKGPFPIEKLCRTYPVEMLEDAIHDLHTGNIIKFWALYLEMLRFQLLPKPEDLLPFLDFARQGAEDRYKEPQFAYVREALSKIYNNCVEWLEDGMEPDAILLEALQDERTVLDSHNRMQAKLHPGRGNATSIPDELVNFPLRYMCLRNGDVILPTGLFTPIYQAKEVSKSPKPAGYDGLTAANRQYSTGKLSDAPSPTHDFPDGNFTLAEIATFLPHSIKSWDVADRIIWNGATSENLALLFNKYRGLRPEIHPNSVYMMLRGQMRKRTDAEHGYQEWETWTVNGQAKVNKPAGFDAVSISVTDFRRPVVFKDRPEVRAAHILFKDLANGVAIWPEHDDALDLTRCVRWCVNHHEAEFYYPKDYQAVLKRVGGPLTPNARHSDASALRRLLSDTGRSAPRHRAAKGYHYRTADSDEGSDATELGKRKRAPSSRAQRAKRRKNNAGSLARQTRTMRSTAARSPPKKATLLNVDSEEDTNDDTYQGPKRTRKNKDGPRRSGRNKSKTISYVDLVGVDVDDEDDEAEGKDDEQYSNAGDGKYESEDGE
ncbi:hypothetical protein E8E11_005299 [Didymella keratinophila]|nr:hypothetical protein E8E11_005299 [Didymella keratinophila]